MATGVSRGELTYPSSMPAPELSIVIPCYNECDQIETILRDWFHCIDEQKISAEWILVNDGSLDGTGRVLDRIRKETKNLRIIHQLNMGATHAIRRGLDLARGNWVLILDSSGCFEPSDFLQLWQEREGADLLVAQRTHRLDPFFRRTVMKLAARLANSIHRVEILDPDVSFRLFRRSTVMPLTKTIPRSFQSFHLATTLMAKRDSALLVKELRIPFRLRPIKRRRIHISKTISDFAGMINELVRLRFLLQFKNKTEELPSLPLPQHT